MNPSKQPKKPRLKPENKGYDFSNPSGSTFKSLTFNKLAISTDNKLTKFAGGITKINFALQMRLNYKKPQIYDAGGDLKKQWFVYYSYKNPADGKFKRFKVFEEINSGETRAERYELANYHKAVILQYLESGKTPFDEVPDEYAESAQNIIRCIDKFKNWLDKSKLRFNYTRKIKYELDIFARWLKDAGLSNLRIGQIKKQHIFEFIEFVKKRDIKSGKTVNHYLNDIRRFFNHYIDNYDDYLERNPAKTITRDPVLEKGNIPYTEEEFEAIKNHLLETDPYLWFVCQVIYYTGLRNEAELLFVRCGDFDLKNKLFFVEAIIAKNKIRQSVPIYPEFAELLQTLNLEQYPPEWYLFGRKDQPGPLRVGGDNFARRFRPVKRHFGFGLDYGLYCLKATRACHLYDDGADIREIQRLFRHGDIYITIKYLKSLGRVERNRVLDKGRRI